MINKKLDLQEEETNVVISINELKYRKFYENATIRLKENKQVACGSDISIEQVGQIFDFSKYKNEKTNSKNTKNQKLKKDTSKSFKKDSLEKRMIKSYLKLLSK